MQPNARVRSDIGCSVCCVYVPPNDVFSMGEGDCIPWCRKGSSIVWVMPAAFVVNASVRYKGVHNSLRSEVGVLLGVWSDPQFWTILPDTTA